VDQYGDIIVMQLTTMGMDKLRDWIADLLFGLCKPKAVFEKSTGGSRKKEGLEPKEGWVKGEGPAKFEVKERGLNTSSTSPVARRPVSFWTSAKCARWCARMPKAARFWIAAATSAVSR
jgi:23S rRNA G2069 N7-methylase RlmK/C1962 C5-methylase RlmI